MLKNLRAVALAAGMAALAPAHAAFLTLDFNLGLNEGDPITGAFSAQHLTITGDGTAGLDTTPVGHEEFLRLVPGTASVTTVTLTMDSGWAFNQLILDVKQRPGRAISVVAEDRNNTVLASWSDTCTTACDWVDGFWPFGLNTTLSSPAAFLVISGAGSIDNLSLDELRTGGGTAPEPASYALAALALGGAGLASRRRKA
jgi:hypothetical protein